MAAERSRRCIAHLLGRNAHHCGSSGPARSFSSTSYRMASSLDGQRSPGNRSESIGALRSRQTRISDPAKMFTDILDGKADKSDQDPNSMLSFIHNLTVDPVANKPHRLHVYATKHNTHLTLVQPPKLASEMAGARAAGTSMSVTQAKKMVDMVLSLSTGNIGFRKAGRGSYDAAYQLAAFTMKQLAERGIVGEIRKLEVVLRGFGAGREAVTKALLGPEGRLIRNKISAVVDATRLKQGGPRAPKPRRLG